jgi:hypothetical protein
MFCMFGGANEIYACPGNTEYVDAASGCQFVCHEVGMFPSATDCHDFIRCDPSGEAGVFNMITETCPAGLAFNPISSACESESNVLCIEPQ